jgi:hypothetical protein
MDRGNFEKLLLIAVGGRQVNTILIRRHHRDGFAKKYHNRLNPFLLWERHLAAMIVAGSHSHRGDTSLPTGWRGAP